MKLEYKILWIDNNERIYTDHQKIIEGHLLNLGFTPLIEKGVDYNAFVKFKGNLQQFDLFLLDYKLDGDKNGNEIIKDIREENYTDVIFYSTLPDEVRQKIYDDKLNGVYYTSRDFEQFEDDVIGIIDVTIKKVQDVNNLRGLIMAEVAELERIKEKIIIKASPKISEKNIEKYVLNKIKSSGTSTKNKAERLLADIDNVLFEELFKDIGFIDLDKKLHATGEILNKLSITAPISKNELIEPYKEKIRDIRNKFAHIEESDGVDDYGMACKVIGDIPFTEENCINIRKEIKKYKGILTTIENQL